MLQRICYRRCAEGLNDGGDIEGQNLLIEYRWSDNGLDRLATLAADLVRRQCAVIVAGGNAAALAAKAATATIPIVFATGDDPINIGLVPSLNRPEGNVTGIFFYLGADLQSKQLGLLREVVPNTGVIGVLVNPKSPQAESQATNAQEAARALGLSIAILNVRSENDFDIAFATLAQQGVGALLITGDAFFTGHVDRLVALTARQRIPAIQGLREFAAAGALMTYGANITDAYQAGRGLHEQNPQGGKTCRITDHATDQVRAGDQPQDRQGTRPRSATDAARPRRRGDRMIRAASSSRCSAARRRRGRSPHGRSRRRCR